VYTFNLPFNLQHWQSCAPSVLKYDVRADANDARGREAGTVRRSCVRVLPVRGPCAASLPRKRGWKMRVFRLCAILIVLVGASIIPARSSGAAACSLDCVRINQGCRADGAELWTCSTLDALCFGPTAGAGFRSACTRGGGFISTSGGGLLCSCRQIGID